MSELSYGVVLSLKDARDWADNARREDLRGAYPASCVVLDMAYSNALFALRAMLFDDDQDEARRKAIAAFEVWQKS